MASHGAVPMRSASSVRHARSGVQAPSHTHAPQGASFASAQPGAPRRRHTGRVVAAVIGILVVLVLVVGGTAGFLLYRSAMTVKASASELMSQMDVIKWSIKNGDSDALSQAVDTVVEKTALINTEVEAPVWDLAAAVPVVGEDVKSVQTLGSVASDLVNEALVPVSQSISGLKLSDLMQDGSINVDMIKAFSGALSDAAPVIQDSAHTIAALPKAHISQVQEVLGKVQGPIADAGGLIDQIKPMLDLLPQMLGADGQPRTYLVIAQNNAELRATGGLPGSWGTITIDNGVLSMGEFTSILHRNGLEVSISDDERSAIATNMNTDPAQVNCTADFTRVGELSKDYWAQMGMGNVDGVIAIDPVFLQRLLALTGGLNAPDGTAVDGSNAAKVLLSDTYWKFGNDGDAQDAYFASVATLAFEQVMNNLGKAEITDLMDVIEQSGKDGRLIVWMANADEQSLVTEMGFSGRLETDPAKPVLGVYFNDDTYSKMSWYAAAKTQIGEGVKNADGTTTYDVVTTLTNTITPQEAMSAPAYVYGGNPDKRSTSDMLDFVFFYAPAGGTISNMSVSDGALFTSYGINEASLSGLQVLRMRTHLKSGETATFTYQVTVSADATEPLALRTTPLAQESLMQ